MAVFAYGRVGADGITATGREELERAGHAIDRWYADDAQSANVPAKRRPQFAAMLRAARDGDIVVIGRLECLGRDARELDAAVRSLAECRIRLVVVQLGMLELTAAAPALAMLATIAEMEAGVAAACAQSGAARGGTAQRQTRRPSQATAQERAEIVTEYSQGHSVSDLVRRHQLSRAAILSIVAPRRERETEEHLPIGWGD